MSLPRLIRHIDTAGGTAVVSRLRLNVESPDGHTVGIDAESVGDNSAVIGGPLQRDSLAYRNFLIECSGADLNGIAVGRLVDRGLDGGE